MNYIDEQIVLGATDVSVLTLPKRYKGLARRLRLRNDTGAPRTITFQDRFTPDASGKVLTPTMVTLSRYGKVIPTGTEWELDGSIHPIFELLHNFRVASDVAGCILAYKIELV